MKVFKFHSIVLSLILFSLATLTSCTGTQSAQHVDESNKATSRSTKTGEAARTPNMTYPPLASAIAASEIKGLDGSAFTMNDKKGRVVLLNLWATWCGPCRAEMPALAKLQSEFGSQGLEVIGLNTDEEPVEKINEFVSQMDLNYGIAYADTKLQSEFIKISKFPGIPQSFLVDRDGHLRGVFKSANPETIKKMEETVASLMIEQPNP